MRSKAALKSPPTLESPMRACRQVVPAVIGVLLSLSPLTACSPRMTSDGPSGGPAPRSGTNNAPQPIVPRQFKEVAEANWTSDMPLVDREIECRNGKAWVFNCQDVNLLSFIPARALGDTSEKTGVTSLWGWTDSASGREFVLAGMTTGTAFIEITDPLNPRYLGSLPNPDQVKPSYYHELKVYKDHAFIVSESDLFGLQVFDLRQLLKVKNAPTVLTQTARYDRFSTSHTVTIDTSTGFAYMSYGGGGCGADSAHIVDIRNPTRPAFAGCSSTSSHDAQCVLYHGPDQRYRNREICIHAGWVNVVSIVDVTDKRHPKTLGALNFPDIFVHQGRLTDDQRYFFLDHEAGAREGKGTRTTVLDLSSLDDPVVAKIFYGTTQAMDHNLYVRGRYVYQSNYEAGLRVLDASDPLNPKEVGYFDVALEKPGEHGGSWDNYPYFKNGVIAVSCYGIEAGKGVYIVRHRAAATAH